MATSAEIRLFGANVLHQEMDVWPTVGDKLESVDDGLRIVYIPERAGAED